MKSTKNYCTLYIVRHGETDWNVKKLVQGHTDIPLNKTGEKQASELASKLNRVKFDSAFSSDLLRAKRTAEIITLEKKIAVKTTEVIRERYYGRMEGKSWEGEDGAELKRLWHKMYTLTDEERKKYRLEKVENNDDMMRRFIPFVREVCVAYARKTVLIVTHGGLMRAFLIHVGFGTQASLPSLSIRNTAYVKLESDGTDFFVKETFGVEKQG